MSEIGQRYRVMRIDPPGSKDFEEQLQAYVGKIGVVDLESEKGLLLRFEGMPKATCPTCRFAWNEIEKEGDAGASDGDGGEGSG